MSSWPSARSTRIGALSAYADHLREAVPHDRGVARDPLVVPAHRDYGRPSVLTQPRARAEVAQRGADRSAAAARASPRAGSGSACANDSSDTESNGTTWRWTWGTSSPTIITPMRRASSAACWAWPIVCATWNRCAASVGVEVDPVVDLGAGHDERVPGVHRVDGEERDALAVAPDERRRGSRRR